MLYIAENLKNLRRDKGWTQEETAEILGLSAQSVSKWERGETLPDITLLPSLANLFAVSVDELLGMDKINDAKALIAVFTEGHRLIRAGMTADAAAIYTAALKTFPNDAGLMTDLAMAMALCNTPNNLEQAVALCRRVLADTGENADVRNGKIRHTARAALCYIHMLEKDKTAALAVARNLPHTRESREVIVEQIEADMPVSEIVKYLTIVATGDCCDRP